LVEIHVMSSKWLTAPIMATAHRACRVRIRRRYQVSGPA
jgi:hypothetical protein